jgi:hypothetical protein
LPVKLAATGSTAVATPDTRTDVQRYVDEIAPSSIAGRMIKFSKEGKFVGQQCPSLPHPFSQPRKVPKILREP